MKIKPILACILMTMLSSSALSDSSRVEASNGWINNLPPSIPMRAGYMLLQNDSDNPVTITRIESSAFGSVEMHQTRNEHGLMKMVEISSIEIPADGRAELKPGGMHLMLMQPQIALPPGTEVPLTLYFEDGGQLDVRLKVAE